MTEEQNNNKQWPGIESTSTAIISNGGNTQVLIRSRASSSKRRLAVLALFLSSSKCLSFSPASYPTGFGTQNRDNGVRHHGRYSFRLESKKKLPRLPKTIKIKKRDDKDRDDGDSVKSRWLGWMSSGRRSRGVAEVKMREAMELGGVPRSDRYSSSDWFHNTLNLPSSEILRAVRGPVIAMTSWATFLAMVHRNLLKRNPHAASLMCISPTTHSLMVSALGLLLVFRTNSAYQRFVEGRKIWGNIVNASRDLYRYLMMYEKEIGVDKRRRVQRLLAAFPYLLRHRVRPNLVMHRLDDTLIARDPQNTLLLYQDRAQLDNDPEAAAVANQEANMGKSRRKTRSLYWVDRRTLPWRLLPPGALEQCARAQNRPLWVCDRMAQELREVPDGPTFTNRERLTLISHVDKLSRLIGDCERIHQTAVPLNYARHSLRALTLWLLSLPFALLKDLNMLTGPSLFLVSWLLFGVYEIGYAIEDPFQEMSTMWTLEMIRIQFPYGALEGMTQMVRNRVQIAMIFWTQKLSSKFTNSATSESGNTTTSLHRSQSMTRDSSE
ncbi:UPF0187 protein [Seminavis robusta]|uniref:UPF0187 protein n=1 Tax=Seminavis robusta TaxID=568900 RepID=A0A9N8HT13_9STRA|nr:UPF0187 protein [Seminavis robusta]|eukprot:Sro1518_g279230.1 UPF0187 protein (551) ;mRNA; r:18662-20779